MHCFTLIESDHKMTVSEVMTVLDSFCPERFDYGGYSSNPGVSWCERIGVDKPVLGGRELLSKLPEFKPYFFISADGDLSIRGLDWSDPFLPELEDYDDISDWVAECNALERYFVREFDGLFIIKPDYFYHIADVHI